MSYPFGENDSFNSTNIKYLTIENVLGDYIDLINYIKIKYNAHEKPVIAFGGGYGGNLAAWMRMKYPQTIQGALASSAPILSFDGLGYDLSGFGNQVF